jgi:hypothetical protein
MIIEPASHYHINLATLRSGHRKGLSVNMYSVAAFTTAKQAICNTLQYHLGGCKCTANNSVGTVKYLNSSSPAGMSVAVTQAQNPAE